MPSLSTLATRLWNLGSFRVISVAKTSTRLWLWAWTAGFTAGSMPMMGRLKVARRSSMATLVAVLQATTIILGLSLSRNAVISKANRLTVSSDLVPYGTWAVSA